MTVINNLLEKFNKPTSVRLRINIDIFAQHPIFFNTKRERRMFDRVAYLCPTTGTDVWTALEQRAMMNVGPLWYGHPFAANKRRAQYQSINQGPMDKSNGTFCESCAKRCPFSFRLKCSRSILLIDGVALLTHPLLLLLWVLIRNK